MIYVMKGDLFSLRKSFIRENVRSSRMDFAEKRFGYKESDNVPIVQSATGTGEDGKTRKVTSPV